MEGTPITTPPVIKAAPEDEAITIVDESAPEIVKLATDGDVILVVPRADRQSVEKSFLVSSHVLAQASTYFKERFQTDTREGWSIKAGNCPRIILEEKSAKAVEVILYKLHFVNSANHNRVTASTLMEIAKYCYKYHSNAALSSWMRHWFLSLPKTASVKGHPFLIVAAHYAENKDLLQAISARVSFWITRSEWQAFKGNFPDADLVLPSELMGRSKLTKPLSRFRKIDILELYRTSLQDWRRRLLQSADSLTGIRSASDGRPPLLRAFSRGSACRILFDSASSSHLAHDKILPETFLAYHRL